jgi:hypothetical protein
MLPPACDRRSDKCCLLRGFCLTCFRVEMRPALMHGTPQRSMRLLEAEALASAKQSLALPMSAVGERRYRPTWLLCVRSRPSSDDALIDAA